MDELNQKPTKPMLAEARRLAFFADEVLSQDILNSYEKTEKYIKRHTQILTEKGMIQKVLQPHNYYTKEEIQESKRWRDRMVRRLIHWPLAVEVQT